MNDTIPQEMEGIPQAALDAKDKGFFTKAEWLVYKHLLARYKSTHEKEFVATDTYFKGLGITRRTISSALIKFQHYEMLKISRDKKQGQKYGARKITLRDAFFNPMASSVQWKVWEMKDRKNHQLSDENHLLRREMKEMGEEIKYLRSCLESIAGRSKGALDAVDNIDKLHKKINKQINSIY